MSAVLDTWKTKGALGVPPVVKGSETERTDRDGKYDKGKG